MFDVSPEDITCDNFEYAEHEPLESSGKGNTSNFEATDNSELKYVDDDVLTALLFQVNFGAITLDHVTAMGIDMVYFLDQLRLNGIDPTKPKPIANVGCSMASNHGGFDPSLVVGNGAVVFVN
ncbi:hypothetical protein HDU67_004287 [Dinochytrium kinnereticum]|nr:hypothetical protein HDU67_004287 [Dinochytrium kinnereticum]